MIKSIHRIYCGKALWYRRIFGTDVRNRPFCEIQFPCQSIKQSRWMCSSAKAPEELETSRLAEDTALESPGERIRLLKKRIASVREYSSADINPKSLNDGKDVEKSKQPNRKNKNSTTKKTLVKKKETSSQNETISTFSSEFTDKLDGESSPEHIEEQLKTITSYPLYTKYVEDDNDLFNVNSWPFMSVVEKLRLDMKRPPSVSTILNATMPEESRKALEQWEARMIAKLGFDGFLKYKNELFAAGTNLHACVAEHLMQGTPDVDLNFTPEGERLWKSIKHTVRYDISDVKMVETKVVHPALGYLGIFDCLARYRNELVVIDWKTSEKVKARLEYTYENPLQLVAYLGAINHDPALNFKVSGALLVIAYRNGREAHVHRMTPEVCQHYWNVWLQRLHQYWSMRLHHQETTTPPT